MRQQVARGRAGLCAALGHGDEAGWPRHARLLVLAMPLGARVWLCVRALLYEDSLLP